MGKNAKWLLLLIPAAVAAYFIFKPKDRLTINFNLPEDDYGFAGMNGMVGEKKFREPEIIRSNIRVDKPETKI